MAEEEEEVVRRLEIVDAELDEIQAQINSLLDRQSRLVQEQSELRQLVNCCRASQEDVEVVAQDWSQPFQWDEQAQDLLLNVFGIKSFRKNQREIINALMSSKNVVVIMAAGGGKSLCYQLPALLKQGIALVVSPLLSLIQDQVMGLTAIGVPAAMLTSTTSKDEEKSIYQVLENGNGDLRVLYVTPEKISKSKRFVSKLEKCERAGRLSLIAIDEAHCCSQWGHDFRPDYRNLGILKKQFPKVAMIALTATATERVQRDLQEMLQIFPCEKFTSSVNRPNLFYEVRHKNSTAAVIDDIASFIRDSYPEKESGIVYCFSRKECEQVAEELRKRQISAEHYHADMEPNVRAAVHRRWSTNKLQVIVGTVAFGMGINKPDVRFVIHHSLSKSLETYYQESGRAGRDGLPSHCLIFYRPADVPRQSCMVFSEATGLQNLYAIARYCQSKKKCRRAAFFQYFGENLQECNGMCDSCAFTVETVEKDITDYAKSMLKIIADNRDLEKKVTMLQLVDLWRSALRRAGVDKDISKDGAERIILQLILEGILKEEFQHTAYATNAYVNAGVGARLLLQGRRNLKLEFCENLKPLKAAAAKMENSAIMRSSMAQMLDELRQKLAGIDGGIFPYAVLSSQHISTLCTKAPSSVAEITEILGKRKAVKYGEDVLAAIKDFVANPDNTGWVDMKERKQETPTPRKTAKDSGTSKRKAAKKDEAGTSKRQKYIKIDSDSQDES